MEYIYYLDGLCCPNCAMKMEAAISKHKEIQEANVVFMKKKLIVEPKKEMTDQLFEDIKKIVKNIESHVEMLPYDKNILATQNHEESCESHEHHHEHGEECCGGHEHHYEHHHEHGEECCSGHEHHHDHHHEHGDSCCASNDHAACACGHDHGHSHNGVLNLVLIGIGLAIFIAAVAFDKLGIVNSMVYVTLYIISYVLVAYDVLAQSARNISRGQVFDEFFLMSVATFGALIIGEYPEAVAVMLFYKLGEYFQQRAVDQARGSIESLVNIKPDFANVIYPDGKVVRKNPEDVRVGDIIEVKAGERIPLDGELIEGSTSLNMAALTGETKPVDVSEGANVLSGSINVTKYIKVEVKKEFGDSTVARIMEMVENAADKKSKAERFVTRFARVYTPIVCFLALALGVIPPLVVGGDWAKWLYNALSFLVVSCPCALVISVPLGFFGGIGVASKNGILLKGGNYLEALAEVSVIAFDKTGTLTKGSFKVSKLAVDEHGIKEARIAIKDKNLALEKDISSMKDEELLTYLLSLAEKRTNHPIGKSILAAYGKEIDVEKIRSFEEVSGYGLVVETVYGKIIIGNEKMMKKYDIAYKLEETPSTVIYGALNNIYFGAAVISDEIKQDSIKGIKLLGKEGIEHTVLLSGDSNACVEEVAKEVGIETYRGELLPGDKLDQIEQIYQENPNAKVAYVGDGINDAPVLARVDVGIAMGGVGQDAAIEAADMVLMTDEIGKIAQAVAISKYTRQIVTENILFTLAVKVLVLILIAIGHSSMWMAVFADVGAALIAVCNSIRVYKHKF